MLPVAILVLVGLVLVFEARQLRAGVVVCKLAASSGFVALAVRTGALGTRPGQAILVGLALSWVGDAFLLHRGRDGRRRFFLAGLVAFLAAHVAYAVAFVDLGLSPGPTAAAAALVALPSLGALAWLRPHVPGRLRWPVVGYVVVISAMVATAGGAWSAGDDPRRLAAAVLFYLSDLSVARQRFVAPGMVNRLWGLPAYYVAQILFALSV